MANKFIDWTLTILLWLVVVALVAFVLWGLIQPLVVWTDKSEMRLYIRLALLLLAVLTFGILRLYNSMVQNTRFLVKLHTEVGKVLAELPNLQRSLITLTQHGDSLKGTLNTTNKTLGTLSEEARELLTALKQNGTPKNPH